MILGSVVNLEAAVEIELLDSADQSHRILATIDTGYNGQLTLPGNVISSFGLPAGGHIRGMLADGSVISMPVFLAKIDWLGSPRAVVVTQAEGGPLLGMEMLNGHRVIIDAVEGGEVRVEELPRQA